MDTNVTRRNALRMGTLAAIAAGLLGTVKPATVNAAPQPAADTVYMADLMASSRRLQKIMRENLDVLIEVETAFEATLTPDQLKLKRQYESVLYGDFVSTLDFRMAELCRHIPSMATTIVSL